MLRRAVRRRTILLRLTILLLLGRIVPRALAIGIRIAIGGVRIIGIVVGRSISIRVIWIAAIIAAVPGIPESQSES